MAQLPDLDALVNKWQALLRLRDWNVQAKYVHRADMVNVDALGECDPDSHAKHAAIRILYPDEQPDELAYMGGEPERVLIHELIHLHFDPFWPRKHNADVRAYEQAINMLSDALYGLSQAGGG